MKHALSTILAVGLILIGATQTSAASRSIQSFLELEPQWGTFAATDTVFTLEGRYSSISRTTIRFRNCNLSFRAAPNVTFPTLFDENHVAEVVGRLKKNGSKFEFIVDKISELPSDSDTIRTRLTKLSQNDAAEYYALGKWAHDRGTFYEDAEIEKQGVEIYRRGVDIERRSFGKDSAKLLELAARLPQYHQPDALIQELRHEAFLLIAADSRRTGQPLANDLARRIKSELKGADTPLEQFSAALLSQYQQDPLAAYRAAVEASNQEQMHRLLYATVALSSIQERAAQDGSNGGEIAAQIEVALPEAKSLAMEWRDRELEFQLKDVEQLNRADAVALADLFRVREKPERAKTALERWLTANAIRQRRDSGASGLLQAADDYVDMIGDRKTAGKLLVEAYALSPESKEIADRLTAVGYTFNNGRWLSPDEKEMEPEDTVREAIRAGRVQTGMTAANVRQALGLPVTVTRIISRDCVNEVWIYGQPGTSRLAVHLLRREFEPTLTAVAVTQASAK